MDTRKLIPILVGASLGLIGCPSSKDEGGKAAPAKLEVKKPAPKPEVEDDEPAPANESEGPDDSKDEDADDPEHAKAGDEAMDDDG